MFREIRRKDRAMNDLEIQKVLEQGEYGILASTGEDDFPYAIPYSYVVIDGKIYIHCTSQASHSKDNLKKNHKICFTVVGETEILPDKFGTCYESVVVFGTVEEIKDSGLILTALNKMLEKYSADFIKEGQIYIEKMLELTTVMEITPIHMTGKARRKSGKTNLEVFNK
ncbi:MAG: pyridoxamine 5'-phosphate oxidase family protein [Clostridia bacterium]|nr:pyridoxamine 5'-phosphate oxidase family protein [Clostridia bacterium]NCD03204.1 pyridoxamine 5'-phosphate oxidase family protein [Clostridia bacterium]